MAFSLEIFPALKAGVPAFLNGGLICAISELLTAFIHGVLLIQTPDASVHNSMALLGFRHIRPGLCETIPHLVPAIFISWDGIRTLLHKLVAVGALTLFHCMLSLNNATMLVSVAPGHLS